MSEVPLSLRDTFAMERRERIWRLVNERGRVRTSELAQLFSVTEPTIRKDIADLESRDLLRRAHGGALARRPMAELPIGERERKYVAEKQRIARACLAMIEEGDAIFLDGGTTNTQLAMLLADQAEGTPRNLKVITNSFAVAEVLANRLDEHPVVIGGRFRPQGRCFVGPLAMKSLEQFRVDIAFIGVTGVNGEGAFAADLSEAEIKTAATKRAARVVIPMDHSKVGLTDFVEVCPLSDIDVIVTDRPDEQMAEWAHLHAITVAVADGDGGHADV
jgi:DeoR/GlpR family transcriptional regulator of sugar metabolism